MGSFHVFHILQMVPNQRKRLICNTDWTTCFGWLVSENRYTSSVLQGCWNFLFLDLFSFKMKFRYKSNIKIEKNCWKYELVQKDLCDHYEVFSLKTNKIPSSWDHFQIEKTSILIFNWFFFNFMRSY